MKDVKKEDGWVLLNHSLNLADIDNVPNDYIVLYNQASGDLKIFLYPKNSFTSSNNNAFWQIYCEKPQGWFNGLNEVSLPSTYQFKSSFDWSTTVNTRNKFSAIEAQWNAITIPCLAYDPNAPTSNMIHIESYAWNASILELLGETEGGIEGKIISEGKTNSTTGIQSSIATYAGNEAETWAKKNIKTSNTKVTSALTGTIGDLVKKGAHLLLNSLFGRFSKTTYQEYNVKLNIQTTSTFKGAIRTPTGTGIKASAIQIGSATTGKKLGAWTLSENPIVYMHPVGVMSASVNGIKEDEASYQFIASGNSKVDLVINPELLPYVVSYSVECIPVAYIGKGTNPDSKLPAYPVSDYTQTDFGSLGSKDPISSYLAYTSGSDIYSNEDFTIYNNNARGTATFWRLWNKYGEYSSSMPMYKYVYAPSNSELSRGGAIKVGCKYNYAKVIVTIVTKFEGKTDTIVTSRTYKPRFEWDPAMISKYANTAMKTLQGYAANDAVLKTIDNGYYDRLLRENSTYSIIRNDSLIIEKISDKKLGK